MLQRLRQAGLIWPTLATIGALTTLIALGTWQLHKKARNEGQVSRVAERLRAEPVTLAAVLGSSDPEELEFRRAWVKGRFDHDREFHVRTSGSQDPWSVVTPLALSLPIGLASRYPTRIVLVIRGVVTDASKDASTRPAGQVAGEVEFVGRVRFGMPDWFNGKPDLVRNRWSSHDLAAMRRLLVAERVEGSASGAVDEALALVAPLYIEAEASTGGEGAPVPRPNSVNLPKRHLEYALAWYGLAATSMAAYCAFAWSRLPEMRRRRGASQNRRP
jgi:surfeit locus 1 family protein